MAFDPDAWLKSNQPGVAAPAAAPAPAAGGGGFDPDAWLSANAPKQPGPYRSGFVSAGAGVPKLPAQEELPENRPRVISGDTATALGALNGMSGSWLDEVASSLGAYGTGGFGLAGGVNPSAAGAAAIDRERSGDPTGTRTQREMKQEIRQDVAAAREQHPWKFGLAEFGGGMLTPGPKGAAGLAVSGGAYGAGASEAETVGGVVDDAASGALVSMVAGKALQKTGQAAGAVGRKVFGEAGRRVEERATNKLLEGTPARTVQDPALAALGGRENIPKVLKKEGIKFGPAAKVEEQVTAKLDEVGEKAGKIYDRVVERDPGVPPEYLRDRLMNLAQRFRHDPDSADAIRSYANRLNAEYTDQGAMNARDLHDVVKALGRKGYGTNPQNPSMGSQLKREIRGEVLGVLQQHVDDVAKQHPDVGSLAELRELNSRYRSLVNIAHIAEARAERDARVSPTFWQRGQAMVNRASDVAAIGGMVHGLTSNNPSMLAMGAGVMAATRVLPHVASAADRLATHVNDATLVNMLRTSPSVEVLMDRAVRMGIPRELALHEIRAAMGSQAGELEQLPPAPADGDAPLLSGN